VNDREQRPGDATTRGAMNPEDVSGIEFQVMQAREIVIGLLRQT
jgi:hypothetical protein